MDTNTSTNVNNFYSGYCGSRLPCGVCRLMMERCPLAGWGETPIITCNGTGTSTVEVGDQAATGLRAENAATVTTGTSE